jgi:tetratricopeptide (TPR) repeat protein
MPLDDELSVEKYLPLHKEGRYQEMLDFAISQEGKVSRYWEITALMRLGRYDEGLEKGLSYGEYFKEGKWKALYFLNIGSLYHNKGEQQLALKYWEWSYELGLEHSDLESIHRSLFYIGAIHSERGDLDRALEFYLQSLSYTEKIGDETSSIGPLSNIGYMLFLRGEIDEAEEYFQQSVDIANKLGDKRLIVFSKCFLWNNYYLKGDWDAAADCILPGYKFNKEKGNLEGVASYLEGLIIVELQRDRDRAKQYLDELEKIEKSKLNPRVTIQFKLSSALYYKSSKRNKDKVRSELLLTEVINSDIRSDYNINAIPHLIELLLIEFKAYGEEEVLEEIYKYIEIMDESAKENSLYPQIIKSQVIKSQLKVIEGKFDEAEKILENSKQLAKEKNLKVVHQEVVDAQNNMVNELREMKILIQKNASIVQRLEKSSILAYIKNAQKTIVQLE